MPEAPVDSIVQLTQRLVRIPSQAGVDPYEPIFECISRWLRERSVAHEILDDADGGPVALCGGGAERPAYLLAAPVDTATFGDAATWDREPVSGDIVDGWLHGRGAADCKVGVAIICHVAAALPPDTRARLAFLFDAGEHTGAFAGIRAYLAQRPGAIAGAMIAYPGPDRIVVGARGFWRAVLHVHGESAHSGSSTGRGRNAAVLAARLITALDDLALPAATEGFPLPPKITVTGVRADGDFSRVPDLVTIEIDVRLTPTFGVDDAEHLVRAATEEVDRGQPGARPTRVEARGGWPAYRLPPGAPVARALQEAARAVYGREIPLEVVGPSNIGNLLAGEGVEATCGFGARYENIHAANERIEIASIAAVYDTYLRAAGTLVGDERRAATRGG